MIDYIIIENWYEDPDEIRSFAISKFKDDVKDGEKDTDSNGYSLYPGYRSKASISNLIKNRDKIEFHTNKKINPNKWIFANTCNIENDFNLLEFDLQSLEKNFMGMKVRNSDLTLNIGESLSNGCFQYCTKKSSQWIHKDLANSYAAVIYLTPNAPKDSGTGFFELKKTQKELIENEREVLEKQICSNFDNWEMVNYIENLYNRCVIFNAKKYHSATKYFGSTVEDSRLTQVFFFDLLD